MSLFTKNIIKLLKVELSMIQEDIKQVFFDGWRSSLGLFSRLTEHMGNIWLGTIAEQSVQTFMEKRNYDKIGDVFLKQIDATTKTFVTSPKNKLFLSEENEAEIDSLKKYIKNFIDNPKQSSIGLNYLFVGVPGTGKTYSMKIIWQFLKQHAARKSYKCFFFPGSFFKKYSESDSVKAISALFDNINKLVEEGKIVALFVDEIDALLASTNHRSDLLNHFLSNISNLIEKTDAKGKFITIGSSNHPQVIDEANARRFKMIRFESPSNQKKIEMFSYYLNKYARQFKVKIKISTEFLETLISLEDNLTGSDIENIAKQAIALRVYLSKPSEISNNLSQLKSSSNTTKKIPLSKQEKFKKDMVLISENDILKQCFNIIYTKYEISLKLPQNVRDNFRKKANEITKNFEKDKDLDNLKTQIINLKKYMLMVTI